MQIIENLPHRLVGFRGEGKVKNQTFLANNWRAPSVRAIMADPHKYISNIPEAERFNIYFTSFQTPEDPDLARVWVSQDTMPFDIDDIDQSRAEDTARFVCEVIGLDYNKTAVVFSGHGLQLHVQLENKIKDQNFFRENRKLYQLITKRVTDKLKANGMAGHMDPSVFSSSRLMRMPETINSKPEKGDDVRAYVIQPNMEAQGFSLVLACGAREIKAKETVSLAAFKKFPAADTEGVESGCEFLKWSKKNQNSVSEPQWYATLGIVGFLPGGDKLAHAYSEHHPQYSKTETDFKLEQATAVTGPRTCKSVDAIWGNCKDCQYFGLITTPIQIKSENFIETAGSGFYTNIITASGNERRSPAYADLMKHYKKERGPFFTEVSSGSFYTYSKEQKYWSRTEDVELLNFAEVSMKPSPRTNTCNEFSSTIARNKIESSEWMTETTKKKLNMRNGVLDLDTGELSEHSDKYGFMSILPYDFDPKAKAPKFETFLSEVSCNRPEISNLLLEFMGYCMSGDSYWIHKALFLVGSGSNGKSTFNQVLKALAGRGYFSTLNFSALQNDQNRVMLEGKLFNVGDENSPESMLDSDIFKTLASGEEFTLKVLYKQPLSVKNKAKLIFNCNDMPRIRDKSEGLFRRVIFVPFDASFSDKDGTADPHIDKKLAEELPGILNLALAGYNALLKRGHFEEVSYIEEMMEDYRHDVDDVARWFDDRVEPSDSAEHSVTLDDLYDNFIQYCETKREKYPSARPAMSRRLYKMAKDFPHFSKVRKRDGGSKRQHIIGIKLKVGF